MMLVVAYQLQHTYRESLDGRVACHGKTALRI